MKKITRALLVLSLIMTIAIPVSAATPDETVSDAARSYFRNTLRVAARQNADNLEIFAEDFADNIKVLADNFGDTF